MTCIWVSAHIWLTYSMTHLSWSPVCTSQHHHQRATSSFHNHPAAAEPELPTVDALMIITTSHVPSCGVSQADWDNILDHFHKNVSMKWVKSHPQYQQYDCDSSCFGSNSAVHLITTRDVFCVPYQLSLPGCQLPTLRADGAAGHPGRVRTNWLAWPGLCGKFGLYWRHTQIKCNNASDKADGFLPGTLQSVPQLVRPWWSVMRKDFPVSLQAKIHITSQLQIHTGQIYGNPDLVFCFF